MYDMVLNTFLWIRLPLASQLNLNQSCDNKETEGKISTAKIGVHGRCFRFLFDDLSKLISKEVIIK